MNDQELLAEFRAGSQQAFSRLVARHVDWVYSVVLRQVRDRHLADDVTQSVFILLAKKGPTLKLSAHLGPWLFKVAQLASLQALRTERRRKFHERKATSMPEQAAAADEAPWEQISPLLDDLVSRLSSVDRACILLRFYQRKTFPEIGGEMGLSEEAARKRVDRAVEKLRDQFHRRGITTTAGALAAALSTHTTHAAAATAVALCSAPATATAVELANATLSAMAVAKIKVVAAVLFIAIMTGTLAMHAPNWIERTLQSSATPGNELLHAIASTDQRSVPDRAPAQPPVKGIARGWPVVVQGAVTATPSIADLDRDGYADVIVPAMTRKGDLSYAHPNPDRAVRLYALRFDGRPLKNWPVELVTQHDREARESARYFAEDWASSPTICYGADGKVRVVLTTPYFLGIRIIDVEGVIQSRQGGSQWASVPVVDLNRSGYCEVLLCRAVLSTRGDPADVWPADHPIQLRSGFAPAIGDANADGGFEIYHLFAATSSTTFFFSSRHGDLVTEIGGYDQRGRPLPGWPRKVINPSWCPPVLGDITGDGKKEVVGVYRHVFAWTWDGKDVAGSRRQGELSGILVSDVDAANAPATLVDLDGDGAAEIIVYDRTLEAVRAWHGDGRPVGPDPHGILARLPTPPPDEADLRYAAPWAGVSAADLAGDGIMDLFCGIYWIRYNPKTQQATIEAMLPELASMGGTQPALGDVDRDGYVDVVFGLRDGRVFVYNTAMPLVPRLNGAHVPALDWPTVSGNFQHTGVSLAQRRLGPEQMP